MNSQSKTAVSLFEQHRIVSPVLSNQYKIDYQASAWIAHAIFPSKILTLAEANEKYPQIQIEFEKLMSVPSNFPDCAAKAFMMDTEFLGKQVTESTDSGIVFVLPDDFGGSLKEILNQKPSSVFHRAIDFCGYANSYCWKVNHDGQLGTYDLWVDAHVKDGYDLDEGFSFVHYWTDIIIICGEMVGIGGFYYSSDEAMLEQVDAYGPTTTYKPWREFSAEEIQEAKERADAVGSIAPWFEHVCIDKDFRRYRQIEVLRKAAPRKLWSASARHD